MNKIVEAMKNGGIFEVFSIENAKAVKYSCESAPEEL